MSTLPPLDFDDLYLHLTKHGFALSRPGDEQSVPIYLRVFVIAEGRDRYKWWIDDIQLVTFGYGVGTDRVQEFTESLEQPFLEEAKQFFYETQDDRLTDHVNLHVLPSYEDLHPYTPITL